VVSDREYPFGESIPEYPTTAGTTGDVKLFVTTYTTNPFHGWRRVVFAFDEWAHRHNLNGRGPLRWLCVWWDRRLDR
jgi:hypothetical protein